MSLEGGAHQGCSLEAVNPEMNLKVEDMVLKHCQIKVHEIAHDLDISVGSVETIVYERLFMTKFTVRWILLLLTYS